MANAPSILITRPLPDALETKTQLEAMGYACLVEPMLTFCCPPSPPEALMSTLSQPFQAIILTSRNGVRALHQLIPQHPGHWPIIAVGQATAQLASEMGFSNVTSANGNTTQLVAQIVRDNPPSAGMFLCLGGTQLAQDVSALLIAHGYPSMRIAIYDMQATTTISDALHQALTARTLRGVTFFSKRTADIFIERIQEQKLTAYLSTLHAFCLSTEIAATLPCHHFAAVHSSSTATDSALREVIGKSLFL